MPDEEGLLETLTMRERVLEALPHGEWRGGQRIARDVFGLGDGPWQPTLGAQTRRCLRELEAAGLVERRDARDRPAALGADEWRRVVQVATAWTRM